MDLSKSGECFALSHNKFGKMVSIELSESEKECFENFRCFMNGEKFHSSTELHCDGDGTLIFGELLISIYHKIYSSLDVTRCGAVMCSLGGSGYYPAAFYTSKKGLCAFDKIFPVKSLEAYYQAIQFVIGKPFHLKRLSSSPKPNPLKIIKINTALMSTRNRFVVDTDAYLVLV